MTVGIVEVNAMRVVFAAVNFDAGVFKRGFDALVVACGEAQGHVIDFAAAVDFIAVVDFEQGDTLVAAFEETLPGAFMIDLHA